MNKVERFFIDLRTIYLFFKLSFFEIWLHTVSWKDLRCTVWWVLTNVYTIPQSRIMHCSHKFLCVISHSFPSSLTTPSSNNHFSDFYPQINFAFLKNGSMQSVHILCVWFLSLSMFLEFICVGMCSSSFFFLFFFFWYCWVVFHCVTITQICLSILLVDIWVVYNFCC